MGKEVKEGSTGPGKNRKKLIFEGMRETFHRKPRPLWDCLSLLGAESTPETWQWAGPGSHTITGLPFPRRPGSEGTCSGHLQPAGPDGRRVASHCHCSDN